MTTPDWVKDAIFYQIFPDRFAKSPTQSCQFIAVRVHGTLRPHITASKAAIFMA